MSKSKDLSAQLAALNVAAVKDDPHAKVEQGGKKKAAPVASPPPKKKSTKKNAAAKKTTPTRKPASGETERSTVFFTPGAVAALSKVQGFLLSECGARSTNVSMAVSIALEFLADELPGNKAKLQELYESRQQEDGRKRRGEG